MEANNSGINAEVGQLMDDMQRAFVEHNHSSELVNVIEKSPNLYAFQEIITTFDPMAEKCPTHFSIQIIFYKGLIYCYIY